MIAQIGIALTGAIAISLVQSRDLRVSRWACIFGLAGQPFWFASALSTGQWGTFFVCCLYAASWTVGLWRNWIQPWIEERRRNRLAHEIAILDDMQRKAQAKRSMIILD